MDKLLNIEKGTAISQFYLKINVVKWMVLYVVFVSQSTPHHLSNKRK